MASHTRLFLLFTVIAMVPVTVLCTGCIKTEEATWPDGGNPFDIKKCDLDEETGIDSDVDQVGFSCVYNIFVEKCADCHTVGEQGNVTVGNPDILQAYENSQQPSYSGGTVGNASLIRISNGTMPPGMGCTGNPATDEANELCLNQFQYEVLETWIDSGQLLRVEVE